MYWYSQLFAPLARPESEAGKYRRRRDFSPLLPGGQSSQCTSVAVRRILSQLHLNWQEPGAQSGDTRGTFRTAPFVSLVSKEGAANEVFPRPPPINVPCVPFAHLLHQTTNLGVRSSKSFGRATSEQNWALRPDRCRRWRRRAVRGRPCGPKCGFRRRRLRPGR